MSTDLTANKIRANPKYQELVRRRRSFAWGLSALVLVIYYGFILIIAFAPKFLGSPLVDGGATTIGLPIGVGVILSAIGLTGVYVRRANGEFDRLTRELIEGSK